MDPVGIIIGIGIGGSIGFGAMIVSKNKIQSQLSALNRDRDQSVKALQAGKHKTLDVEKHAQELKSKLHETAHALQAVESKKKALDAEIRSAKKKLAEAVAEAQKSATKAMHLEKTTAEQNRELQQLKTHRAQATTRASTENPKPGVRYNSVAGDLQGILRVLCNHEKLQAAVLADNNGFLIAAFGKRESHEGLAATANWICKFNEPLRDLFEFASVGQFCVVDINKHVIAGRTIELDGERIALATVSSTIPANESLEGAITSLHAALC